MKRVVPPLCIAVVATVVAVQSIRRSPKQQRRQDFAPEVVPCTNEVLALVDGLDVGQNLADFSVTHIRCLEPKGVEIDLHRGSTPLALMVVTRGKLPHRSPRQTLRHDLFYTRTTPPDAPPTQKEIDALLMLLATRVEQAERKSGSGQ
ncbi:MAG: hypothetical protein IPM54_14030 [Polyangiaceae bacterium]|nr:hypothetical protein [Polyangiaceae bacterium]